MTVYQSLPTTDEFPLHFTPARECQLCLRWTYDGTAQRYEKSKLLLLTPYCPEHGYYDVVESHVTKEERALEYASIERFTVWAMGEYGIATVIGPCPAATVPGYDYAEHNTDWSVSDGYIPKAWAVLHTLKTEVTHVHVVYDNVDWKLSLYVNGKRVQR